MKLNMMKSPVATAQNHHIQSTNAPLGLVRHEASLRRRLAATSIQAMHSSISGNALDRRQQRQLRANSTDQQAASSSDSELNEDLFNELMYGMGSSGIDPERPGDVSFTPDDKAAALAGIEMGTWRLRGLVCPQIQALVAQIELCWRSILGDDMRLYPLPEVGTQLVWTWELGCCPRCTEGAVKEAVMLGMLGASHVAMLQQSIQPTLAHMHSGPHA
jgi:hypothetical protein